jgi:hypothetical protein
LIESAYFLRKQRKAGLKRKAELKHAAASIAEKRAKETRCAPAKRLEITARLPFNFVLVLSGNF